MGDTDLKHNGGVAARAVNEAVTIEREGSLGWVVLTRPGQINAINDDVRNGVPHALRELDADPAIRVIAIRGAGLRGFCAGADIKEKRGPETAIEVRSRMQGARWIEAVDTVQKPVIAAVHGYCMGGGLELALACDIRYATPDAVFSLPETALGLIPGGGGTQRLARVVGPGRAMDLLLTGERLDAAAAKDIGLVTRVASASDALVDEVRAFATRIAARAPAATLLVKRAARSALDLELKQGLDLELDLFAMLKPSEDAREAALAFSEKRPPNFIGR
ncbi:enoyl-CoA hydratase/isomerase family protein [Massilia putida]|uniref:enoyl-CoA hydratase/isomerase family protein n=1 Tax=Massilia putida TaxID=1141883 RepID=UPI000952D8F3|nr:enoyl-CoA hydratase/isomerase family protein [Massilia putida]